MKAFKTTVRKVIEYEATVSIPWDEAAWLADHLRCLVTTECDDSSKLKALLWELKRAIQQAQVVDAL